MKEFIESFNKLSKQIQEKTIYKGNVKLYVCDLCAEVSAACFVIQPEHLKGPICCTVRNPDPKWKEITKQL